MEQASTLQRTHGKVTNILVMIPLACITPSFPESRLGVPTTPTDSSLFKEDLPVDGERIVAFTL